MVILLNAYALERKVYPDGYSIFLEGDRTRARFFIQREERESPSLLGRNVVCYRGTAAIHYANAGYEYFALRTLPALPHRVPTFFDALFMLQAGRHVIYPGQVKQLVDIRDLDKKLIDFRLQSLAEAALSAERIRDPQCLLATVELRALNLRTLQENGIIPGGIEGFVRRYWPSFLSNR